MISQMNLPEYLENNGYINTENNIAMYFDLDTWDGCVATLPIYKLFKQKMRKHYMDFALV